MVLPTFFIVKCWVMKPEPCLILVGMMGSGKSMVGNVLATKLERPFQDTDQLVSQRLCQPISQFFKRYGEAAFREHETNVLKDLQPDGSVLATGGGIVTREENWHELQRLGTTVFLDVKPDILISRLTVSPKKRPLLELSLIHI